MIQLPRYNFCDTISISYSSDLTLTNWSDRQTNYLQSQNRSRRIREINLVRNALKSDVATGGLTSCESQRVSYTNRWTERFLHKSTLLANGNGSIGKIVDCALCGVSWHEPSRSLIRHDQAADFDSKVFKPHKSNATVSNPNVSNATVSNLTVSRKLLIRVQRSYRRSHRRSIRRV